MKSLKQKVCIKRVINFYSCILNLKIPEEAPKPRDRCEENPPHPRDQVHERTRTSPCKTHLRRKEQR